MRQLDLFQIFPTYGVEDQNPGTNGSFCEQALTVYGVHNLQRTIGISMLQSREDELHVG